MDSEKKIQIPEEPAVEKPGYWAVLTPEVRYDGKISSSAKLLYAEISALTTATGYCYATNSYFQRLYGITERTVIRLIRELESRGVIRVEDAVGGRTRRRIYAGINPLQTPDKNVRVPLTKMSPPPDKNATPKKNNRSIKKENNPPKAPQGAGADFVPKAAPDWKPERFAAFWDYFPLHKSKQAAIRAWDKLKPSDELLAVIGKALRRQIAEEQAKAEKARRPFEWKLYASTYLNNARWTDAEEAEGTSEPEEPERRLVGERC